MEELIRYLFAGIGIGSLVMGLWALYCIDRVKKERNRRGGS